MQSIMTHSTVNEKCHAQHEIFCSTFYKAGNKQGYENNGEITIKPIAHLKHPNKLYHNEIYHITNYLKKTYTNNIISIIYHPYIKDKKSGSSITMTDGFTFLHVGETCIFKLKYHYQLHEIFKSYPRIVLFKFLHVCKSKRSL